jgi:3-oxoacyl-[acyl-carrier protein] reductase
LDLQLKDRVYIVTGGTRGLGLAAAQALTADGAKVVVSGLKVADKDEVVRLLGGDGQATVVAADNADPNTPTRLIDAAHAAFGKLDGVLISVGGPPPGTAEATDEDQWRTAFDGAFLGAVRLAQAVAKVLDDGGVIGFVLSTSVYEPIPGLAVSNVLRPGLAGYAKTLADELGPRGIRVVGFLPAHIATDRQLELASINHDGADAAASIPLRRFGQPEEFGRLAAFYLSPAASYVTGSMVSVDGGARAGF